ncbi:hypothetical protein [Lactobacillus sp. PV034]|uniref:hypothetical protein n=1 Tax=Lactobacillus sp. PV034 TaxID=2594495 RepID=UPI0022409B50|nr:hypothetical protein [Lactobacillus sp. PV034]QNQ81451.1 hypothetical protein FP432_07705 [Lactobacillus sp. PV034]
MQKESKLIQQLVNESNSYQSPVVLYSHRLLINNLNKIIKDLSYSKNRVYLFYSVKANMNPEVLQIINKKVSGFSISSDQEYESIRLFKNKIISRTGFSFLHNHISKNKEIFYFNSISQLENFLKLNSDRALQIGIRIRAPRNLYDRNSSISRFGFSEGALRDLESLQKRYSFKIDSILIHQENKVLEDWHRLSKFIKDILKKKLLKNISSINLGGGWDNLFLKNQIGLFINHLGIPIHYDVYIEPGSAIVRTIGILKAAVIDENEFEDKRYIVVDTSQFNNSSWYIPRIIGYSKNEINRKPMTTNVYGNTCYEKDYFGQYTKCTISFGSKVFMFPIGAYYSTTHRELHGIKFPREYVIYD